MQVREIMSHEVIGIDSNETVQQAAQMMAEHDFGSLPVFENGQLAGVVTDRDIAIRAAAAGKAPCETPVGSVMTAEPVMVSEDMEPHEAAKLMEERQIRRLLVQGTEGHIVGVVSLGDMAMKVGDHSLTGQMIEGVSQPAEPVAEG